MHVQCVGAVLVLMLCTTPQLCAVSNWGEVCNFTDECADHRLVCVPDAHNVTKCACDRFHQWHGSSVGCVQMYNASTILNMTMSSTDNKGELEKDTLKMFTGQKIAGFFVMSVALLCPIVIGVHCFHMRRKDRALKREVREIKQRVDKKKRDQAPPRAAYESLA